MCDIIFRVLYKIVKYAEIKYRALILVTWTQTRVLLNCF